MNNTQVKIPWPGWEIVRRLGGGSFGQVYEIQRSVFGSVEKAALKIISVPKDPAEARELLNNGYHVDSINQRYRSDLEDIAKEYQLMAQLKGHSNIVHCEDLSYEAQPGGIGWSLYIKMELLTPMNDVMTVPVQDQQVINLGMDLCTALTACKRKNIIHRDIKPANIMVSADGTYKLGDFGVAKTTERTAGGTKTGTFNYMAPEVYNNQPYGLTADQYSLGMVMYWMLNGRCTPFLPLPPTVPTASQIDDALRRRFRGEALPAPAYGSDQLKQIVLKACAYDPKDRYSSPEALYEALSQLAGSTTGSTGYGSFRDTAASGSGTVDGGTMGGSSFHSEYRSGTGGSNASFGSVRSHDNTMGNGWDQSGEYSVGGGWSDRSNATLGGGTVGTDGFKSSAAKPQQGPLDMEAGIFVTPQEALQGCRKNLTLPGGKIIAITVPAGSADGQVLRLKGAGKQDPATGARGTLYIKIKVDQDLGDFWSKAAPAPEKKPEPPKAAPKASGKKKPSIVAWFVWLIIFAVGIFSMGPVGACITGAMLLLCAWGEYLIRSGKNAKLGTAIVFVVPLCVGVPISIVGSGMPIPAAILLVIAGFCSAASQK